MSRRVRINELASKKGKPPGLLPVCASTIYRWISAGKFPPPIKIGAGRTAVWDLAAVEKFIAECGEVQK